MKEAGGSRVGMHGQKTGGDTDYIDGNMRDNSMTALFRREAFMLLLREGTTKEYGCELKTMIL